MSCQNIDLHPHEYEILVIDNASTDDSVHRVSVLQKQFPQLRLVINEKNYGRIGNWNRILELADSDFLLFEMIGDEINSVSLRDDLIQMKQEKAFIRYGAQDIAGNHNRFFKKFSDS